MWLRRKKRRTVCPICNGALTHVNGKNICKLCRIEIRGSSLKPLHDDLGGDTQTHRLRG